MAVNYKSYVDDNGRECIYCGEYKTWKHFDRDKHVLTGHRGGCKACCKKRRCLKKDHNAHLKRKYGITLDIYNQMLENQQHGCKICGKDKKANNGRELSVDHCHHTGEVRGLLCQKCNVGLGQFEDNINLLRLAMQYLTPTQGSLE